MLRAVTIPMLCLTLLSSCNRASPSKAMPSPIGDNATLSAIAFAHARFAEQHQQYSAAIRFRAIVWSYDKIDLYFHSQLLLDDAADFIALGKYAQARARLRLALAPFALDGKNGLPVFKRGLKRPTRADYVAEFKRRGGRELESGRNDNPCTGDSVSALAAAIGGSFNAAKRRLSIGFQRPGCPTYQMDEYMPYLAAVSLSQGRRDEALVWLSRCLTFRIPQLGMTVISQSTKEAAFIFSLASNRDLEKVGKIIRQQVARGK